MGAEKKQVKVGGSWCSWRRPSKRQQREIATENVGYVSVSAATKGGVGSR